MKSKSIEIICQKCKCKNYLNFEESDSKSEINCSGCNSTIYWHVCKKCETGFYNMNKDFKCPDCTVEVESSTESKIINIKSHFSKECPWCGKFVGVFSLVFSKQTLGQCKSCKKYYKASNQFTSLLIYVLYLMAIAVVGSSYIKGVQSEPLKIIIASMLVLSGLVIYIKILKLDRYKF